MAFSAIPAFPAFHGRLRNYQQKLNCALSVSTILGLLSLSLGRAYSVSRLREDLAVDLQSRKNREGYSLERR